MTPTVVYEDSSLLIIDKPHGIASLPGKLPDISSCVFQNYPEIQATSGYRPEEGGLLNRLDNETGGLLLFARNDFAFQYYRNSRIKKHYYALVHGIPPWKDLSIENEIAHHYSDPARMVTNLSQTQYRGKPQPARTICHRIKTRREVPFLGGITASLLELEIVKGVRHQIRIHLAYEHLPIIGDKLYQKRKKSSVFSFHFLSCYMVELDTLERGRQQVSILPQWVKEFLEDTSAPL